MSGRGLDERRGSEGRLDDAIRAMIDDQHDEEALAGAASRAWAAADAALEGAAGTASEAGASAVAAPAPGRGRWRAGGTASRAISAADRELITAYLAGRLSEGRAMLVADRIRDDAGFRKAVAKAQAGVGAEPIALPSLAQRGARSRWAIRAVAAGVALAIAFGGWAAGRDVLMPGRALAHVEVSEGALYAVQDEAGHAVDEGEAVTPRHRLRAREGGAVLRLADGTLVELDQRTELSLASRWNGTEIRLERGNIIVQAAPQGRGRLYVATGDCEVAVKGTIFAVGHGAKGSRVSVIEGAVAVNGRGERAQLEPGDQFATHSSLAPRPIADEIAWSRDRERYTALLRELRAIGDEIEATVARPAPRTASTLIESAPSDTLLYAALPNLSRTVRESYGVFRERVADSPELSRWWSETGLGDENGAQLDVLVERMASLGDLVGDEIGIAVVASAGSSPNDGRGTVPVPVVIAEVADGAAFRASLAAQLDAMSAQLDEEMPLRVVGDAAELPTRDPWMTPWVHGEPYFGERDTTDGQPGVGIEPNAMWVWATDGLMAASPSPVAVAAVAAGGSGPAPAFREAVSAAYGDGIDWLLAVDMVQLAAIREEGMPESPAEDILGLDEARYLVATEVTVDGRSQVEATLAFDGERSGAAAWLAEPAPMGGLAFVSPDAHAAAAWVVDDPEAIVRVLFGWMDELDVDGERDAEAPLGRDILSSLAEPMGGEVVVALDGPVLPRPGWRAAVEVYDAAAMQAAIQDAVGKLNALMESRPALGDQPAPRLVLAETRVAGRAAWSLALEGFEAGVTDRTGDRIAAPGLTGSVPLPEPGLPETDADARAAAEQGTVEPRFAYAFADGYLVVGNDEAGLEAALRQRASGVDLTAAAAFTEALPTGAEGVFSAIVWQDLGAILAPALEAAGGVSGAATEGFAGLAEDLGPSVYVAWATPDGIRGAGTARRGPFGMAALLGLRGLADVGDVVDPPAELLPGPAEPPVR